METDNVKGIPEFWLTIFKNVGMLDEMVQEHDEPILKHLYDIKVIFLESDPMVINFFFLIYALGFGLEIGVEEKVKMEGNGWV